MRMIWPLENARASPSMPRTRAMKRSALVATSFGDSPRAAVAEEFPARSLLEDVPGQHSLKTAIVPFHQIGIGFRDLSESRQLAGLRGSLQGTGEHVGQREAPESFAKLLGAL